MTDVATDLVERFERLELDPASFRHRDHVHAAYAMLSKYPFLEATLRYANTIRTMASSAGAEAKFHMTITVAFMALIAERMESARHRDFEEFEALHPELFAPDVMTRLYSKERLESDVARRVFVLPDEAA